MKPNKGSSQQLLEETQALHGALHTIRVNMPSLILLTQAERRQARWFGGRQLALIQNCLEAAQNKTVSLPCAFGVGEFVTQARTTLALHESLVTLRQLVADVQDTLLAVGVGTFRAGQEVAIYAKTAARRTPGLKCVAERLNLHGTLNRRPAQAQAGEHAMAPTELPDASSPVQMPMPQRQSDTPVTSVELRTDR